MLRAKSTPHVGTKPGSFVARDLDDLYINAVSGLIEGIGPAFRVVSGAVAFQHDEARDRLDGDQTWRGVISCSILTVTLCTEPTEEATTRLS